METIIGYIPKEIVENSLLSVANEIADVCACVCGREKDTVPVMIHKMDPSDGNATAGRTIVFYVYVNEKCQQDKRQKIAQEIYKISKKHFPKAEAEHHLVIFKLHEDEDMGINGVCEG